MVKEAEWAMAEEEDSVAKETQQVEFIKPLLLLVPLARSSSPNDSSQKIINKIQ